MRILPSKVMARPRKGNVALNLSINEELKRLFESQCALEGVEMSEADVLRYVFETGLLTVDGKVERKDADQRAAKDAMVTVRTTSWMAGKMEELWRANPEVMQADVLRALLERILPIARDKGMAHVMKLREMNL